ncbi:MAG: DUF3368 domain-containing protein [Bacteroidetes bacterium]|nr:DUF3368 domain-containing protein [Bacteroidota bacterium]
MPEIIISDTSCLILLSKINELEILKKLYNTIYITEDVLKEYGLKIPPWFNVQSPIDKTRQQILEIQLGKGEASSLALAIELKDSVLILDDYKARKIAKSLDLKFSGTLGILIKAKKNGHIKSLKSILEKLKSNNYFISEELESYALKESEELS